MIKYDCPLSRLPTVSLSSGVLEMNMTMSTIQIAVFTVEPAGKASFVYSCMQTRLMIKTMENEPRFYGKTADNCNNRY